MTQEVAEKEVVVPESCGALYGMEMKVSKLLLGFGEEPPLGKLGLPPRDVFVALSDEIGDSRFDVSKPFDAKHDVDNRFRPQPRDGSASDMLDLNWHRAEHPKENHPLGFETTKPCGVVRYDLDGCAVSQPFSAPNALTIPRWRFNGPARASRRNVQ